MNSICRFVSSAVELYYGNKIITIFKEYAWLYMIVYDVCVVHSNLSKAVINKLLPVLRFLCSRAAGNDSMTRWNISMMLDLLDGTLSA